MNRDRIALMPDNRNRKRPIQVKFFVDESKLGLNSKIKKFSDSFICGKGAVRLKPNISRNKCLSILDMGLCPIAPPKGFPVALWKPSGANT